MALHRSFVKKYTPSPSWLVKNDSFLSLDRTSHHILRLRTCSPCKTRGSDLGQSWVFFPTCTCFFWSSSKRWFTVQITVYCCPVKCQGQPLQCIAHRQDTTLYWCITLEHSHWLFNIRISIWQIVLSPSLSHDCNPKMWLLIVSNFGLSLLYFVLTSNTHVGYTNFNHPHPTDCKVTVIISPCRHYCQMGT